MLIYHIIPDAEAMLAIPPSELAGILLERMNKEGGERYKEHPGNFSLPDRVKEYPSQYQKQCSLALMEAWCFLVNEGLLIPEPGNSNNWHVLSRLGLSIKTTHDYESFLHSNFFPKKSIHPEISNKVFSLFLDGDYETAIFKAFKLIEVATRNAAGSGYEEHYGVDLMRKAFHPSSGPLTDTNEPTAEREALMHLFSGAIGRFKNPSSHRHVPVDNPQEAIEILQFASHLMRIIDDRNNIA